MVRKTEQLFKRKVSSRSFDTQIQTIRKITIWVLFIPIYSNEKIINTNIIT